VSDDGLFILKPPSQAGSPPGKSSVVGIIPTGSDGSSVAQGCADILLLISSRKRKNEKRKNNLFIITP
jgi:hypothetical protein